MEAEVMAHHNNHHWKVLPKSAVPYGTKILPCAWAMKRKPRIASREVYKWKARLNLHGGKQEYGVNYWETYAATLSWPPIRFMLILSLMHGWSSTCQIDFTLAYPQADVECDLYMEIPHGFNMPEGGRSDHCLKILKNIYGQKQAGQTWSKHLTKGLLSIGFVQSEADECIYYRGTTVFMVYVDDSIFISPDACLIDECIELMRAIFNLTDEGDISDYLGIQVSISEDAATITLTQPHLIASIADDIGFTNKTKSKGVPASPTVILQRDLTGEDFAEHWSYRSIIGKLNFLEKSTRPDIAYAVHQCARFSANPKASHAAAVRNIVCYLIGTPAQGIVLQPNKHSFVVWADADFCGNWYRDTSVIDTMTAKSLSGYAITYASCPVLWASKLQTEVALSTTEAEYVCLSQSLWDTIPLMNLLAEVRDKLDKDVISVPAVRCTLFEDNSGALELARTPKMRPRTKHINIKYHHFRDHVQCKLISIEHVATEDQVADFFTKPLPVVAFLRHRKSLQRW